MKQQDLEFLCKFLVALSGPTYEHVILDIFSGFTDNPDLIAMSGLSVLIEKLKESPSAFGNVIHGMVTGMLLCATMHRPGIRAVLDSFIEQMSRNSGENVVDFRMARAKATVR